MKPFTRPIKIIFLLSASLISHDGLAQFTAIDSLEEVAKKAKPGWDQIDMAVGLARLYLGGSGDLDNGRKQIAVIYENAKEQNIPEARAYGLIMENIISSLIENDNEKSLIQLEEAMQIARQYNCNDALVFAGYMMAERYGLNLGDFKKSVEVLESLVPHMDETVDIKHKANALKNLGYMYTRTGRPDSGFMYLKKSIELFKQMKTDPFIDPRIGRVSAQYGDIDNLIQYALNATSASMLRHGRIAESWEYLEQALEKAFKSQRPRIISWQLQQAGDHFEQRGYYEKALEYYKESRVLLEDTKMHHYFAQSNSILARMMMRLGDYNSAEAYVNNALDFYRGSKDTLFVAQQLMLRSLIHLRMNDLPQSNSSTAEVDKLIEKINSQEVNGQYNQVKGEMAMHARRHGQAILFFKKASSLYSSVNHRLGSLEAKCSLADAFLKAKAYDSAQYYGAQALANAYEQGNINYIRKMYSHLSGLYELTNDYPKALSNYKLFYAFHDSVYTADAQIKLKEEQVRRDVVAFRNGKEQAEASVLQLQKRNQTYLQIGGGLFVVLVLIGFLYMKLRKAKLKIEEKNRERETLLKEIHHRVKNNLQIISSILSMQSRNLEDATAKSAVDEGRSRIKSMSLIHEKLYASDQLSKINMQEYVEELNRFLFGLYKPACAVRQDIHAEGIVMDIDTAIPVGLILNELISNALKYAYEGQSEGDLEVLIRQENDTYVLKIADSGKGVPSNFKSIQSMGMRLVHTLTNQLEGLLEVKNESGAQFILSFKPVIN